MMIDQRYEAEEKKQELINEISEEFKEGKIETREMNAYAKEINEIRLRKASEDTQIVQIVNNFIAQAIVEGASDIHLDPKKETLDVRFRIDGYLYNRHRLSSSLAGPIRSRIKIMSGLDITDKKFPQEGRIAPQIKGKNIEIRTSTYPAIYGENIVLKVLDKSSKVPNLLDIGLSEENLNALVKTTKAARGLVLAAGPAGNGKTTTIYSMIQSMNHADKNIVTIEDTIEREIEGIVQSQIDHASGMTYADALKSILHQDPDMIYVGEIRDRDTASICVRAALAGHMIFSTMPANTAVGAITSLREIGINGGFIESVLNCVFSQRLVRKLCPSCRRTYIPEKSILGELNLPSNTTFYKEVGCEACSGIGYRGRTALFEILPCTRLIKTLMADNAPDTEMLQAARSDGMKSLFEDGLQKVRAGVTTLEEVIKATEELAP
ncbi:MAG: GspE/PulE family protein [Nitrospiria bacterium]